MKLIKSMANDKLFYTKVTPHQCKKESEISIELLSGTKDTLKVSLSINKSLFGKVDLLNNSQLKSAYEEFCSKIGGYNDYFKDEIQFKDILRGVAKKLREGDYDNEGARNRVEITPAIKSMLAHPTLINYIDEIIRKSSRKGFVREWANLVIAYLSILSTKTDNPINLDLTGTTSVGKSYIVIRATIGFNRDFLDVLIGGSKTGYKYMGKINDDGKYHVDLTGKAIVILESSEAEELIRFFKALMSHDTEDDTFEMIVTAKNEISGESESRLIVIHGIPSFILLGTVTSDQDEYLSRTLRASPEISKDKTKESVSMGFQKWGSFAKHEKHHDLQNLRDSMSCLEKHSTANIFASIIDEIFPADDMIRNRDRDKLIGLIESITVLHQHQRLKNNDFLLVSLEDNLIGLMLMDKVLDTTLASVPSVTLKVYEIMNEMESPGSGGTIIPLEEELILDRIQTTETVSIKSLITLREHLDRLINHHLIKVKDKGRGNTPRSYSIVSRSDLSRTKLAPLFIERVARNIDSIKEKYKDFIDDDMMDELLKINYFKSENIKTPIWYITPKDMRNKLFGNGNILETIGNESTKEYIKEQKRREKDKEDIISGRKYTDNYIPDEDEYELDKDELERLDEEYKKHLQETFDEQ